MINFSKLKITGLDVSSEVMTRGGSAVQIYEIEKAQNAAGEELFLIHGAIIEEPSGKTQYKVWYSTDESELPISLMPIPDKYEQEAGDNSVIRRRSKKKLNFLLNIFGGINTLHKLNCFLGRHYWKNKFDKENSLCEFCNINKDRW